MKMVNAESTLIARYGYDPATGEMQIDFHKGGLYRYSGVSQEAFLAFVQAPSKGKHFLRFIKGAYEFQKL